MKKVKIFSIAILTILSFVGTTNINKVETNAASRTVEYGAHWDYGRWGSEGYSRLYRQNMWKNTSVRGFCNASSGNTTGDAHASCWGWSGTTYTYYNIW